MSVVEIAVIHENIIINGFSAVSGHAYISTKNQEGKNINYSSEVYHLLGSNFNIVCVLAGHRNDFSSCVFFLLSAAAAVRPMDDEPQEINCSAIII